MEKIIHRAESRGYADHRWLQTYHTFSFSNYHNPLRMNFGQPRVLNDDVVAPGQGFDTHSHANMEIVSIPLSGAVRHHALRVQRFRQGAGQLLTDFGGTAGKQYTTPI